MGQSTGRHSQSTTNWVASTTEMPVRPVLEAGSPRSEIEGLGEASFLGLQTAVFSLCPHRASSYVCVLTSSSCKDTSHVK